MQFYNGLEESPNQWSGWALSGIAQCGHRLRLSGGGQNDLSATTNWTTASGASPVVEGARFKVTSSGDWRNSTDFAITGNFDLRMDIDPVVLAHDLGATADDLMVGVVFSDGQKYFVDVRWTNALWGISYTAVGASRVWTAVSYDSAARITTIRVNRTGNVFTVYHWHPTLEKWVSGGSTTLAFPTGVSAVNVIANTVAGERIYFSNVRNVVPTVTTGTATSPVLDTVDGFRGLGWFTDAGGTGTVLLEYRTAATSGAVASASWQTATNWVPVTPSSANRYVQVRLTISGGSLTAPSPEVGPILVNGSLDQTNANHLLKRMLASTCRHSNSVYQICMNEAGGAARSYWSRASYAVAYWTTANSRNLTFEGTTWDLADYATRGIVTEFTDPTNGQSGTSQIQVEAATALPALVKAWGILGPLLSGSEKTAITTSVNAFISSVPAANWNTFAIVNRLAMTRLKALDTSAVSGQWDKGTGVTYTDADADAYMPAVASVYLGQGSFQDNPGHVDDGYAVAFGFMFANALDIKPTWDSAATATDYVRQVARSYRQVSTPDGLFAVHGRSVAAHYWLLGGQMSVHNAQVAGGRYDLAREQASRGAWSLLRYAYLFVGDFATSTVTRKGNVSSLEGYAALSAINGQICNSLAVFATDANLFAVPPQTYNGAVTGASLWVGPAAAVAYGGNAADPQLQSHGLSYDIAAYPSSKYAARIVADHFGQNTGAGNAPDGTFTYGPCQYGGGFYWTDSSLASGLNLTVLNAPSSAQAIHAGKGAFVWRTGTPSYSTIAVNMGAATGCTAGEIYYLRGHHAVAMAKVALAADGRTMSRFGFASPPIPLASGDSLSNPATTTTYAYAEAPAAYPETLSVLVKGLTSNLQGSGVPRTGTLFNSTLGEQKNRFDYGGAGVDVTNTADTPSGTVYAAADFAMSHAPMTPASEAAYVGSFSQVGDVITFTFDANGVEAAEDVYCAFTAQNLTNQAVGNYSVTGSAVKAFSGRHSAPDWWGGSAVTSVSHNSTLQATLASAGNLSIHKTDAATTRVRTDAGNVTLYAAALPSGFANVYAYDVFDNAVDVTSSCTVTPGVSVVIPSSVVNAYKFGLARFDVVQAVAAGYTLSIAAATPGNPATVTATASPNGANFPPGTSITLTPSPDGSVLGPISPSGGTGTTTYTSNTTGTKVLAATNNQGLTNPAALTFAVHYAAATTYSVTVPNPTGGLVLRPSANFRISGANAYFGSPVVVTPSDGGAGGVFTPSSVTLNGDGPVQAVNYTPPSVPLNYTLTFPNNGGLTAPGASTYAAVQGSTIVIDD